MMNWLVGYVRDRLQKAVSMVAPKNFLMCATHGGYSAASALSNAENG